MARLRQIVSNQLCESGPIPLQILVTGAVLAGYVGSWFLALARAPAVDVTAVLVAGAIITALLRAGVQGIPLAQPVGLALLGAGVAIVLLTRLRPTTAT